MPNLSPKRRKLLSQVDDLLKELRSRTCDGATHASSTAPGAHEHQEKPTGATPEHQEKPTETTQEQAADAEPVEGEASLEASEGDLNHSEDVHQLLEHSFHQTDIEKAGYTVKAFEHICSFYIQQSRLGRRCSCYS